MNRNERVPVGRQYGKSVRRTDGTRRRRCRKGCAIAGKHVRLNKKMYDKDNR